MEEKLCPTVKFLPWWHFRFKPTPLGLAFTPFTRSSRRFENQLETGLFFAIAIFLIANTFYQLIPERTGRPEWDFKSCAQECGMRIGQTSGQHGSTNCLLGSSLSTLVRFFHYTQRRDGRTATSSVMYAIRGLSFVASNMVFVWWTMEPVSWQESLQLYFLDLHHTSYQYQRRPLTYAEIRKLHMWLPHSESTIILCLALKALRCSSAFLGIPIIIARKKSKRKNRNIMITFAPSKV